MSTTETVAAQTKNGLPVIGRLGLGALSLIVANGGVLLLFFLYDVTLFQLVLVYWCECAWIGIFSAIKLLAASVFANPYENRWADVSPGSSVFMSLVVIFFTSSGFFALLGLMLMSILFANDALDLSSRNDDMINHIGLVFVVSLLLMAAHALSFVVNFLVLGEYRSARVGTLVALPFKRCLALFVVIIASIALVAGVPGLANTSAFAVVVILLKVLWDLRLHIVERRDFARARVDEAGR